MEKLAYIIFACLAALWLVAIITGMIAAMPFGILGLAGIFAIGLLLAKVLRERLANKEDDYYDKNVDR